MTVWCFGSINVDHVYSVPRIPAPGETLSATAVARGLGGKGANQSAAAARAGARVRHIGAVGADGAWAVEAMTALGIGCDHVATRSGERTGHAVISVAADGENAITVYPGANVGFDAATIDAALADAKAGDTLLI